MRSLSFPGFISLHHFFQVTRLVIKNESCSFLGSQSFLYLISVQISYLFNLFWDGKGISIPALSLCLLSSWNVVTWRHKLPVLIMKYPGHWNNQLSEPSFEIVSVFECLAEKWGDMATISFWLLIFLFSHPVAKVASVPTSQEKRE